MKMTMAALVLLVGMAWTLQATPVMNPDGIALSVTDPGIGRPIMAIPGSTWDVWANDNWGNAAPGVRGDFDFNDGHGRVMFLTMGEATWMGTNSADVSEWIVGGLHLGAGSPGPVTFAYTPNVELVVQFHDTTTDRTYLSGPASVNPDLAPHVWTEQQTADTPEPTTLAYMAIGLGLLGMAQLRRRRRV